MNRFVLLGVGALALAACSKPAPSDTGTPAASPTATAPTTTPAAPVAASDPTLQPPSFDCAKALSESEKLVCGDARLAALDRQLAAVYKLVQSCRTNWMRRPPTTSTLTLRDSASAARGSIRWLLS